MNTGWGYLLITGRLDLPLFIFSIPLALHLLNVILIFETPDREADIHGNKKNIIVTYGRQTGFLLISLLFWIATIYFFILAAFGWFEGTINFWILTIFSLIPSLYATLVYLKKPLQQKQATAFAIRTALSLFTVSIFFLGYFIFIQL
jgi:1,4-dihydroxy-2-naphthoate octaprenyltransferase